MKTPDFDRIAPLYDWLAHLVFGKSIVRSQEFYLGSVREAKKILVLGGGTGSFLPALTLINPTCEVFFIDASIQMLNRARRRPLPERIHFICGTEDSIPEKESFDAVLTFYYLDLFENKMLPEIIGQIKNSLSPQALWLAADFVDCGKWWQSRLLSFMYFFFRITCGLRTRKLPEWIAHLRDSGFRIADSKTMKGEFIQTIVFERIE
jgi:tRNA (cmo5U34)-methyltransferase